MNINLTEDDLSQMPSELRTRLLCWQMNKMSAQRLTPVRQHFSKLKESGKQLSLLLEPEKQVHAPKVDHTRVTLTQLYNAGITRRGLTKWALSVES